MKLTKTKLAAAVAVAALGVGMALPASALPGLLQIRLTDPTVAITLICVDGNVACDSDGPLNNTIAFIPSFANGVGGFGAGRAFNVVGLSVASNILIGDPNAAIITSSGNLTATTIPGILPLIIEFSQTGFEKPVGQLRTLSQGATTTFTNAGPGDLASFHALNDQANLIWAGNVTGTGTALPAGAADDFVTPQVLFAASSGDPKCTGVVGNIQSCAGVSQLGGISETNPFSLSQRIVIATGESPVGGALIRVQFTDAATKFATVPEPASVLLFGAGILGLALTRRRKKIE